jgi:hypothetical protein
MGLKTLRAYYSLPDPDGLLRGTFKSSGLFPRLGRGGDDPPNYLASRGIGWPLPGIHVIEPSRGGV